MMGFKETVVAGLVVAAVSAIIRFLSTVEYVQTLRRIRRRTDSTKWLPCFVGGHVEPSVADYEMGEHCICERCGKVLLD